MKPIFDQHAKWWAVEIRFEERLTESQIRSLRGATCADASAVGEDGAMIRQWAFEWPDQKDDETIANGIRAVGIPARVRAAPLGRDCECDEDECCDLGAPWGCPPRFTENEWREIDPLSVETE